MRPPPPILPQRSQELLGYQPQPGYVRRILSSFRPVEQEGRLLDVRRRQSLRRASAGATKRSSRGHGGHTGSGGSGHGHECEHEGRTSGSKLMPSQGVDLGVKEGAETVVSISNAPI